MQGRVIHDKVRVGTTRLVSSNHSVYLMKIERLFVQFQGAPWLLLRSAIRKQDEPKEVVRPKER